MEYVFYLGLGAVSGLISGLFGLGGGAIIVPLLIFAFAAQGISPEIATHLAIGTSLATIVITSLSSIYTHHQKDAIRWDLVIRIAPGIILGSRFDSSGMLFSATMLQMRSLSRCGAGLPDAMPWFNRNNALACLQ